MIDATTDLTRPATYDAPRYNADVVMKGGITSGVVYPPALCELARSYRLRNIGGTSAGAIAAGLAAAAEYGRRNGHLDGYAKLATLPRWLGEKPRGRRRGNLLSLFQPVRSTRSLFELLLLAIGPNPPLTQATSALPEVLFRMGVLPWIGLAPGLLLTLFLLFTDLPDSAVGLAVATAVCLVAAVVGLGLLSLPTARGPRRRRMVWIGLALAMTVVVFGPVVLGAYLDPALFVVGHAWAQEGALLLALLGLLAGCVAAVGVKVLDDVPANDFGICRGTTERSGGGAPGLVPWLHGRIQSLAGRAASNAPLTFADLEDSPEHPIRLRVMTTCLTFGRPYLLPFETKIFYFDPDEFRTFFPGPVVDFMVGEADRWSRSQKPRKRNGEPAGDVEPGEFDYPERSDYQVNRFLYPLRPLPVTHLPILVAVRMSLSFPLLLSAVPLWTIDWRQKSNQDSSALWQTWFKDNKEAWRTLKLDPAAELPNNPPDVKPTAERCWFSDGGICSNFPVYLFDELLPRWPTFGINLKYREDAAERDSRVQLADKFGSGLLEPWEGLTRAQPRDGGSEEGSLTRFLAAIFGAMQNWSDNTMLKVPGYRDRIVHLHLAPDEGSLNLEMTEEQIGNLSQWGREAGAALRERFTSTGATGSELSWDAHRWARLRSSLSFLQEELEDLVDSYRSSGRDGWCSYRDLILRDGGQHPTSYKWRRVSQKGLAETAIVMLGDLVDLLNLPKNRPGFKDDKRPHPLPRFHIRPPLQR